MPLDCDVNVSHMDVFPSIMEYLRIDVSPEMDIDGVSRIQWELSESDKCDLSQTIPSLLLSGAYMFETADADHIQNKTQLEVD